MGGLTLTQQEQGKLQTLNLVLEGRMGVPEAGQLLTSSFVRMGLRVSFLLEQLSAHQLM